MGRTSVPGVWKYGADGSYLGTWCLEVPNRWIIPSFQFPQVPNRWIIASFQYPQVPNRWVVSVSDTWKYRTDESFHHFSTRKYRADGSSPYLVLASTRSRRIIPSFQYPQVPNRWVVSVSGTCKYKTHGSFHHFSTRKYRADGSSRYLVLASTEQMDHYIISVLASTEQIGRLGIWYP